MWKVLLPKNVYAITPYHSYNQTFKISPLKYLYVKMIHFSLSTLKSINYDCSPNYEFVSSSRILLLLLLLLLCKWIND